MITEELEFKENEDEVYNATTYVASKQFKKGLEELEEKVDLAIIRLYEKTGEKDPTVSESIYLEAEELFKIREDAIKLEMIHARSQARELNINIPQKILDGKDLSIGFKKELLEKIPAIGVYDFFKPFTKKELDKIVKNARETVIVADEIEEKNENQLFNI